MRLDVCGIEVDCVIGERPDERVRLQRIMVDVRLEVCDKAAETDELADAVDYVAIASRIREALVEAQCRLVERAALLAAKTCLAMDGVLAVEATISKSGAVPGIGRACATCRLEREDAKPAGKGEEAPCERRKHWWRF